ncbi:unnamed protein product, partial [marine sediment metagenome]
GGWQFHNCWFEAIEATDNTPDTLAIYATNPLDVLISNCRFTSLLTSPFSTAAISLTHDMAIDNCRIENNEIFGAVGITIATDVTHKWCDCIIKDNFIKATTLCIDDNTDDWHIIGNNMISLATKANATDLNVGLAVNNHLTGSDGTRLIPYTDQEA